METKKKKKTIHIEDFELTSKQAGGTLFLRQYSQGKKELHILIVHGAVEHSGRHLDLVNYLLKKFQDITITTYDHIGHGKSGGPRVFVNEFNIYVEDLMRVSRFISESNELHSKMIICSHSLGGLITLTSFLSTDYEHHLPIHGLIFSSPCIKPQTFFPEFSLNLLEKLNQIIPKLHLPMIYSGKDLSRDPLRANDFDTDQLIPKYMSVRMAYEIVKASEKIRGLSYYLKIPSLFLVALADKIVEPQSTLLFAQGVDKQFVQIRKYPDHYHELWNETDRETIFYQMKSWIDQIMRGTF